MPSLLSQCIVAHFLINRYFFFFIFLSPLFDPCVTNVYIVDARNSAFQIWTYLHPFSIKNAPIEPISTIHQRLES